MVKPRRAPLLPLERVLTQSSVWKEMDIARQSQLYSLLDHPNQAAVLSCLDAQELPFLSQNGGRGGSGGGGGLSLFIHRNRPTVFVHLKARLIGIEEREKKVIWLVDDGTGVIAVHHTYKPPLPPVASSSRQALETHARSSKSKGKQREVGEGSKEELCAIPSQYRLPPPPPARRLANATPMVSHQTESMTIEMKASIANSFQIGDLLSIVGRIEVWRWSDERLVVADRVLQNGGSSGRNEREGYVERLNDANEEPRHLLRAIYLSATEYSNTFQIPALENPTSRRTERRIRKMADEGPNIPISVSVRGQQEQQQQQQQQRAETKKQLPIIEKRKALRVMNDIPDDYSSRLKRKGTLGVCRSIVAESDAVEKLKTKLMMMPPPPPPPKQREQIAERKKEEEERKQETTTTSTVMPRRRRQMRRFTKLSDSQMTESTFRVYVEAHIVEACSGRQSTVAEICCHLHTKHLADQRSVARGGTRKRRKSGVDAIIGGLGPPSFSLMYLMHVDDLREHAKRTVEVATKRREEKRRRSSAAAALALNASKVTELPIASSEKVQDKMKRLYISVVQAMLLDGIIVLASTNAISSPPFDGSRQGTIASSDTERFTSQRADSDTYQVVTPSLLVEPIHQIITSPSLSSSTTPTSAQILMRMQALDDRWRFLQEDSVRECLQSMPSFIYAAEEEQSTGAGPMHFVS